MKTKNRFTIIELILAITIFAVMMIMMMDFFNTAYKAMKSSSSMTKVFENARVVFDTIEQDLLTIYATDQLDQEIPFGVIPEESGSGPFPCMILRGKPGDDSESHWYEVTYDISDKVDIDGIENTDVGGEPIPYFMRSQTNSSSSNWDFLGVNVEKSTDKSWMYSSDDFYPLVDGVLSVKFLFWQIKATPQQLSNRDIMSMDKMPAGVYNNVPKVVDIEVTLYDPNVEAKSKARKTKRTFFKRFVVRTNFVE